MQIKKLPPELVSLVHHIALNEKGWWEKTIQRIILASIWLSESGQLSTLDISEKLKNSFGIRLSIAKLEEQIQKLTSKQTLFQLGKGLYKISEEEHRKFSLEKENYEKIEGEAKQIFLKLLDEFACTADPENTWNSFNDEMLSPLIHEMGAKTYELISGQHAKVESHTKFQYYIQRFAKEAQVNIRNVIISFLDPKNVTVREFVLRKLNAYFALEAGNLSENALHTLSEATKKSLSFEVFVDTNFLFSILALHETEVNEAATALMNLIREISARIDIKLQLSKPTLKEAQDVLQYHMQTLKNLRLPPNLSHAASFTELSGLTKKFVEVCNASKAALKSEDYFSPYLNNLLAIIKPLGLKFYNNELANYPTDQRVIDDVIGRLEYEEKIFGQNPSIKSHNSNNSSKKKDQRISKRYNRSNYKSAKTYEILLHDIILWYFVKDRRAGVVESPADAKSWIVTEDFRFLSFDRFKRKNKKTEKVPICIHPATLVQILQFWVPRTPEFEEVILSNLRCPFLFHEFDKHSEKVTVSILEALSLYENVNLLPSETVTAILMNDALRKKITKEKSIENHIQLVTDQIIETNNQINIELADVHQKLTTQDNKLNLKLKELNSLRENHQQLNQEKQIIEKEKKTLEGRILDLENRFVQERAYNSALEKFKRSKDEFVLEEFKKLKKHAPDIWLFLAGIFAIPFVFLILNHYIKPENNYLKYIIPTCLFGITLILSFLNREHCKISFKYAFFRKKLKRDSDQKALDAFSKVNAKPVMTNLK